MSAVTTEIANALNVAGHRIHATRPGEVAIEVPAHLDVQPVGGESAAQRAERIRGA